MQLQDVQADSGQDSSLPKHMAQGIYQEAIITTVEGNVLYNDRKKGNRQWTIGNGQSSMGNRQWVIGIVIDTVNVTAVVTIIVVVIATVTSRDFHDIKNCHTNKVTQLQA